MQPGDVILKFNGEPIKALVRPAAHRGRDKPGTSAKMDVWRKGRNVTLSVKVAELKSDRSAATADEGKQAEPTAENHLGLGVVDVPSDMQRKLRIKGGAQVRVVDRRGRAGRSAGGRHRAGGQRHRRHGRGPVQQAGVAPGQEKAAGLLVRRGDQTQWVAVQPASKIALNNRLKWLVAATRGAWRPLFWLARVRRGPTDTPVCSVPN